jgi:dTDP-4-amino-4,6-dideoxygalactose transaminase
MKHINNRIWLSLAHMSGREQEFIKEAFETNWVVPLGPNVDAFEKQLEQFLQEEEQGIGNRRKETKKCVVALSSGTAAIHLGLLQMGVKPGDEVICQSFTFAATANPIKYLAATPVFIDSEPETWNMSPIFLEKTIIDRIEKVGKKPKVIIPVHLYGMPAKMNEISDIAGKYDIPILEDAAEALGSEYKGQKCGTFGEFACLSFNGNKIITTSGGGALVCSSKEQVEKTKFYATQARDKAPHYQHSEIGYNYRMSNICAGIGRGQMLILEEHIARRREIHQLYTNLLKDIHGITIMQNPSNEFNSNFWLTCILIEKEVAGLDREEMRLEMEAANIETRPLWKPMHLQPVFKDAPFYGDGTSERLFERGLCLPSGSGLTDEDIIRVVDVIKNIINQ